MEGTQPAVVLRARLLELYVVTHHADNVRLLPYCLFEVAEGGHETRVTIVLEKAKEGNARTLVQSAAGIFGSCDRLCRMPMRTLVCLLCFAVLVTCLAQQPHMPDLNAQRAAMKKLEFMVGKWSGEARLHQGAGDPVLLTQTEEVQYKLNGLILIIEGVGQNKADGQLALQALGIVSYDDESGTYRMRAFNN